MEADRHPEAPEGAIPVAIEARPEQPLRAEDATNVGSVGAYYPWLDALRGVSWVLVMVGHSMPNNGYVARMGVGIFFAISGWLITQILLKDRDKASSLTRFYSRRCLRIMPLYAGLIITACVLTWLAPDWKQLFTHSAGDIVVRGENFGRAAVDMLPGDLPETKVVPYLLTFATEGWRGGGGGSLVEHCWSLCVEERFYVFWPLILTLCPRAPNVRRLLITVLIGGIFLLMTTVDNTARTQALFAIPFPLLMGCALAIFHPTVRSTLPVRDTLPVAIMLFTAYLLWAWYGESTVGPTANTLGFAAGVMAAGLVACAVKTSGEPRGAWGRLFTFLGPLSYAAYLFHVPFAMLGRLFALGTGVIYLAPLVGVALCTGFAQLLHKLIELPILAQRRNMERSRDWKFTLTVLQITPIVTGLMLFFPWRQLLGWAAGLVRHT